MTRVVERLKWYRGCWQYDKAGRRGDVAAVTHRYYLTTFTLGIKHGDRCSHRTRRLNLFCLRVKTYDGWCGMHNSLCWRHDADKNRCSA